jgi:hypothetical protein
VAQVGLQYVVLYFTCLVLVWSCLPVLGPVLGLDLVCRLSVCLSVNPPVQSARQSASESVVQVIPPIYCIGIQLTVRSVQLHHDGL